MTEKTFEVFGLGQCTLDFLGKTNTYPPPDTKCELNELTQAGGGPVATALSALTRWGHSCLISSMIGDDDYGERIRSSLTREGIDTSELHIRPESESQIAFVVVQPGDGQRTIFWRRATGKALTPEEVNETSLQRAKVLHTDGQLVEASLKAARTARKHQIPTVVDGGSLRPGMLELARESDFFIASEKFGQALTGGDSPTEACRKLAEFGPELAAITLGNRGCTACSNGETFHIQAYPAQPIDTTGAGDVFHAGFIHGLLKKWCTARSLDFGAWAAAKATEHLGGRTGIPRTSDYEADAG